MRKCFTFLLLAGLMLSLSSCAIIYTKVSYDDNAETMTWGLLERIPIYRYTVERQLPIPACGAKAGHPMAKKPHGDKASDPEGRKHHKPKGKRPMAK